MKFIGPNGLSELFFDILDGRFSKADIIVKSIKIKEKELLDEKYTLDSYFNNKVNEHDGRGTEYECTTRYDFL